MPTRLQTVDLTDFRGGINARRNDFNLADNESPRMLNIEVDPRRGFFTRRGWQRWNDATDIGTAANWDPKNGYLHPLQSGVNIIYVASDGAVVSLSAGGAPTDIGVTAEAVPHLADFASWGDTCYMTLGRTQRAAKRDGTSAVVQLGPATVATPITWNDDYTTPVGGVVPPADVIATHIGYLFVASTTEGGVAHPNRIRWSHPQQPEDFATNDYIDILQGGSRIRALMPFQDHLLIFKENSIWALYGYDSESWQLVEVPGSLGTQSPSTVTKSETAVFFYSSSQRSGIYAYSNGNTVHLSEKLRTVMEEILDPDELHMAWVGRRLWVSVPWSDNPSYSHSAFVFDPEVGDGAWVMHRPAQGNITAYIERSDISTDHPLACIIGIADETPIVSLDFRSAASDVFASTVAVPFDAHYTTGWRYAGEPERRKSWRRPRFIIREPLESVNILVETYWNYDEATIRRSHIIGLTAEGTVFWRANGAADPGGFDWGDGTLWGSSSQGGSAIERPQPPGELGGLGVARSIQMKFSTAPASLGKAWGIDAMTLKFINRRLTT